MRAALRLEGQPREFPCEGRRFEQILFIVMGHAVRDGFSEGGPESPAVHLVRMTGLRKQEIACPGRSEQREVSASGQGVRAFRLRREPCRVCTRPIDGLTARERRRGAGYTFLRATVVAQRMNLWYSTVYPSSVVRSRVQMPSSTSAGTG